MKVIGILIVVGLFVTVIISIVHAILSGRRDWDDPARVRQRREDAEREDRQRRLEAEQQARQRHQEAEREERKRQFKQEVEYAAKVRKLELEVEERSQRLSKLRGGQPRMVLIAELELAEKEAELAFVRTAATMTEEQQEAYLHRLAALRQQLHEEKQAN